jgi:hypothetical protein
VTNDELTIGDHLHNLCAALAGGAFIYSFTIWASYAAHFAHQ